MEGGEGVEKQVLRINCPSPDVRVRTCVHCGVGVDIGVRVFVCGHDLAFAIVRHKIAEGKHTSFMLRSWRISVLYDMYININARILFSV